VDLFTDQEHGVEAAADAVETALAAAGSGVERRDKSAGQPATQAAAIAAGGEPSCPRPH
jgi:hypothetical protein